MKTHSIAITINPIAKEIVRKSIHVTIAFVPTLAKWNFAATVLLLAGGILFYIANETARISGGRYGFISRMTALAARQSEGGFVWGRSL